MYQVEDIIEENYNKKFNIFDKKVFVYNLLELEEFIKYFYDLNGRTMRIYFIELILNYIIEYSIDNKEEILDSNVSNELDNIIKLLDIIDINIDKNRIISNLIQNKSSSIKKSDIMNELGNNLKKIQDLKKCYLMAVTCGHCDAMVNLGKHYQYIEKKYDEMKIYYNMAIELNNSDAMVKLGKYYQYTEKDYDEMKKYYNMAIELNNSNAMINYGKYFDYIEKDYDEMKKYYNMAIELNNSNAMIYLAHYYLNIEKDYDEMKKYYLMAIELNNFKFNLSDIILTKINLNPFKDKNIDNFFEKPPELHVEEIIKLLNFYDNFENNLKNNNNFELVISNLFDNIESNFN